MLKRIEPSIMISVDGSRPSRHAVDYAVHMTRLIPDLRFVLLHVAQQTPQFFKDEARTSGEAVRKLKEFEKVNREKGQSILEATKRLLKEHGVDLTRVETRLRPRISGLAKDILSEAEMGRYDALVIGRRGLTRTMDIFMGSVTNQLIQHAANVPLWIVDGEVTDPHILVAVDGSEASLRAVDHVCFMLHCNPNARVDFLHVVPKLTSFCSIDVSQHDRVWNDLEAHLPEMEEEFRREDNICLLDFNQKALAMLARAGFSKDRVVFETREITLGVARTIIKAAKDGGYGTIVIGRRGLGKSSFLGSVSDRVIRRAENLAIWLVN